MILGHSAINTNKTAHLTLMIGPSGKLLQFDCSSSIRASTSCLSKPWVSGITASQVLNIRKLKKFLKTKLKNKRQPYN